MLANLKKNLFFMRLRLLQDNGVKKGELRLFENDLYYRLSLVYFDGIPLSFYFKYLILTMTSHLQFKEKSLLLTMGFDDAKLVCGNLKNLELLHGKEGAQHYWVENDGWVYDTAFLYRFKKELYYKMYIPSDVKSYSKEEYSKNKWYQDVVNTKIEDLLPGGRCRNNMSLISSAYEVASYEAEIEGDDTFLIQLNEYLDRIQLNYEQIEKEYGKRRTK